MSQAGYRISLIPESFILFIKKYVSFFKVVEFNATEKFMDTVYLNAFSAYCKSQGIENISFNLPEETLASETKCARVCDFMMENKKGTEITMNLCFWGRFKEHEYHAYGLSKVAKDCAVTVALKNISSCKNLIKYLDALKNCAMTHGFKVCLDLGNLFYCIEKNNNSPHFVVNYLKRDPWWKENIIEVHVHDYTTTKSHLNIGEGLLKQNRIYIKRLFSFINEDVPIIFETPIRDIETQGVIEVKEFFSRFN